MTPPIRNPYRRMAGTVGPASTDNVSVDAAADRRTAASTAAVDTVAIPRAPVIPPRAAFDNLSSTPRANVAAPPSPPKRAGRITISPSDIAFDDRLRINNTPIPPVQTNANTPSVVSPNASRPTVRTPSAPAMPRRSPPSGIVYTDAVLDEATTSCSREIWGQPALRPNQLTACRRLVDPGKPTSLLLVERTGGGKTHVTRVVGAIERGIVLVIVPLLALSADQLKKFKSANQAYGAVDAFHIDEVVKESAAKYQEVLARLRSLRRSTTSTAFICSSPQFFTIHPAFCELMVKQANERVLQLIVVNEVHVYVQHGMSFRCEIRELKDVFFSKVFDKLKQSSRPKSYSPREPCGVITYPRYQH